MRSYILIAVSFLFAHSGFSQTEDSSMIKKISDEILSNGKAYENLRHLTKQIGGRLSGSPQMVKAENWGVQLMKESGADKAWLQECMVPHWVRGGKEKAQATYNSATKDAKNLLVGKKELDVLALGNSEGTKNKELKAQVLLVNSFDELEMKKDSVKGKIVFYNYKFNPTFVNTFQSYGNAVQYRGAGASRAAKYGAAAVIVRSMSHSADNNPHTGSLRYDTTQPKIPALAIGLKDADWLSNQLQENRVLSITVKSNAHFLPDTMGHNVIGELTGSEFPNEIITIGGHLDSWDPAEGAHDDGAGVVQTIEVLRTFKALGYKPKRTIRFVLFANEENGLRGGNKYAQDAKEKNEQHIFALESDAGGFTPRGVNFGGSNEQLKKLQGWVSLLHPYGVYEITNGGGGADIGPLNRLLKTPVAEMSPDSQRYFDYHHARNDVFENVNKRELELGAVNMAVLIFLIDKYGL